MPLQSQHRPVDKKVALSAARVPGCSGESPSLASSRGSVTAERAVVLPAMTVLLAILLLSVSAGLLQLRLEEGASAGARALARGDSSAQVLEIIARVSGEKAAVSLGNSDGYATVTVQDRVGGVLSGLAPWTQTAQASVRAEAVDNAPLPQPGQGSQGVKYYSETLKSSLWRWARSPECSLRAGKCAATAITIHTGACHGMA